MFDKTVPAALRDLQQWFGGVITQPLDEEEKIRQTSPQGVSIQEEAAHYLCSNVFLAPHERIQIYNQQYWWRLIKTMQENFPLVLRLFAYEDFSRGLVVPFLCKYPSQSWSLGDLGAFFPRWLEEEYHAKDREIVLAAAHVDWAYQQSFVAGELPALTMRDFSVDDPEALLSLPLRLQPHIRLFSYPFDLFSFREAFLQHDVDYWVENKFPPLKQEKVYCHLFYRGKGKDLYWKEISEAEFTFFQCFITGSSVAEACHKLEDLSQWETETQKDLHLWLRDGVAKGWLSKVV